MFTTLPAVSRAEVTHGYARSLQKLALVFLACSFAAQATVPTVTVTDMLAAHERRLLREDGILAPARHAVTNGFGAVLMTGPGAMSVGTYFIRLRDSDGWAEIRNGEGLLTSEIAPIRAGAQNLIGERFGFIPGDDTPEELRLSHLVSQWEVVSPERAAELEAIDVMASARRSVRRAASALAVTNLMFTGISVASDAVTYTLERPHGFAIPRDLIDLYTSVDLRARWSWFKTLDFTDTDSITDTILKRQVPGWTAGSAAPHTNGCMTVTNVVASAFESGTLYTNETWNCDHQSVSESPLFLRGADLTDTDGDGIADGVEVNAAALEAYVAVLTNRLFSSSAESASNEMTRASRSVNAASVIPSWSVVPLLRTFTNPRSANNGLYEAVALLVGDPSSSHSEKYALTVSPVAGSGVGEVPETIRLVNARYGFCDQIVIFLKKGWRYEVSLRHVSTNLPSDVGRDPDYALIGAAGSDNVMFFDPSSIFGVSDVTDGSFAGAAGPAFVTVLPDVNVELTIDGHKEGAVLKHAGYVNTPEDTHGPSGTKATLLAVNYTPLPGTMTLSAEGHANERFAVWDNPACAGDSLTLPFSWNVAGGAERRFYVTGLERSSSENDSVFKVTYLAEGLAAVDTVRATMVEVRCRARDDMPANRRRHILGPAEIVDLFQYPEFPRIHCTVNPNKMANVRDERVCWVLCAPHRGGDFLVECGTVVSTDNLQLQYTVVEPQYIIGYDPVDMTPFEYALFGQQPLSQGEVGAAMHMKTKVNPATVSFSRVKFYEGEVGTSGRYGICEDRGLFPENLFMHGSAAGASANPSVEYFTVMDGNQTINGDYVATLVGSLASISPGGFTLEIPLFWYIDDASSATECTIKNTQISVIYGNGTTRVAKGGVTWERSLDGTSRQIP